MEVYFEETGTVQGLADALVRMAAIPGIRGVMILGCDANGFTPAEVDPVLKGIRVPVFGGIFPSVIFKDAMYSRGSILMGMGRQVNVCTVPELSSPGEDYEVVLNDHLPDIQGNGTMIVLVDGFARRINAFIESLFTVFGLDISYIGGGAGSLSMVQQPCLFTNDGLIQDAAVLALLGGPSQIGISHGWQFLKGPFRVTESDRNQVITLDWEPAFEVYHRVVSEHIGRSFSRDEFLEIAKAYPFGVTRLGEDFIVRDPVGCGQDQSLVCVGEVAQGTFVSILHGNRDSLIQAAASRSAVSSEGRPGEVFLLLDCISRVLFLEEDFRYELEALYDPRLPMVGACSIGEIASSQGEFLEFYNKTTVSGRIQI